MSARTRVIVEHGRFSPLFDTLDPTTTTYDGASGALQDEDGTLVVFGPDGARVGGHAPGTWTDWRKVEIAAVPAPTLADLLYAEMLFSPRWTVGRPHLAALAAG